MGAVQAAVKCAAKALRCSESLALIEHVEDAAGFSFYKASVRPEPDLFNTKGVAS
jgi:hypothetical protein